MTRALRARSVQKREPGLLGLPSVTDVPLIGPILSPIVSGNGHGHSNPPPAPAPAPAPSNNPSTPTTQPPPSFTGNGGNPKKGGGNGWNSGNGKSVSVRVNGLNKNVFLLGGNDPGSPPQGTLPSPGPSTPTDPSNLPASFPGSSESPGVVNGVAQPGSSPNSVPNGSQPGSQTVQGGNTQPGLPGDLSTSNSPAASSVVGTPLGSSLTSGDANGSSSAAGGGGNVDTDPIVANAPAATNSSHLSSAAVGGIIAIILLISIILGLIFVRRRYKRRQEERRVTWIQGVSGDGSPLMTERMSVRSSWGTPVERGSWDRLSGLDVFAHNIQQTSGPVLPMPVHSPIDIRSNSPEDPFADTPTSPQPLKRMSSLPIRISLISSGSQDPFDDMYQPRTQGIEPTQLSIPVGAIYQPGLSTPVASQAHFPIPPETPTSAYTIYAIGSPTEMEPASHLKTPAISISFPDSPVSPTFAAYGTSSYPRRASVKQKFQPSNERKDEVLVEEGDAVSVVSIYADGWAFVQREKDQERGLVPLNYLEMDNKC
ncbi:hypothetical protein BU17DRAFT_81737 [Hysterangium stoloniferum]|nr:hypothetical protein BU17DRAFT_81737 [Hysterangium stoloniferum]